MDLLLDLILVLIAIFVKKLSLQILIMKILLSIKFLEFIYWCLRFKKACWYSTKLKEVTKILMLPAPRI